jgi:transmembrane sensor
MSDGTKHDSDDAAIRSSAAQWIVRRDRGLSNAESIEFELWLAGDPRHRSAIARSSKAWSLLDQTPDSSAQRELAQAAARRRRRRNAVTFGVLAAAAGLAITITTTWRGWHATGVTAASASAALTATGPREVILADGTLVRLNTGGEVREDFDVTERRVHLIRGEGHFTVVSNASRPFIVVAGALRVRAVGTAFNVNLEAARVQVLVTEGTVRLVTETATSDASVRSPLLHAGELATVASPRQETQVSPAIVPEIQVTRLDQVQIARTLAWHESLVRLGGATLAELAHEFERRFGERILMADPAIGQLRAGGRVRADDAESFARLLATTFDLDVERGADGTRTLRKKTSNLR